MNEPNVSRKVSGGGDKPLPPPYTDVLVRCKEFRCQAYLDGDGKWRSSTTREELPEVLEVYWDP